MRLYSMVRMLPAMSMDGRVILMALYLVNGFLEEDIIYLDGLSFGQLSTHPSTMKSRSILFLNKLPMTWGCKRV